MDIESIKTAISSRIFCAITVHYNVERLKFLSSVLQSLASFPVQKIYVTLFTNAFLKDERSVLNNLCSGLFPQACYSIESYGDLEHPFDLAWCHKDAIIKFARDSKEEFTHFVYLEDDIQINFAHFCYFIKYRDFLRGNGLIPSFLRTEYSQTKKSLVNVDNKYPVNFSESKISSEEGFFL